MCLNQTNICASESKTVSVTNMDDTLAEKEIAAKYFCLDQGCSIRIRINIKRDLCTRADSIRIRGAIPIPPPP